MSSAREAFTEYVEREYAPDDGLHWDVNDDPYIYQEGRSALLWEEWLVAQAMFAAGVKASAEVEVK